MSKSRKDPHKRKLRQQEVRAKVLARREEIRVERKALAEEVQRERKMHELEHGKPQQLLPGNQELAEKVKAEREAKTIEKIKRNLDVLKRLEEEYDREQSVRSGVNKSLESEGFSTLKEKIDAMQDRLHKYVVDNADPSHIDGNIEPPADQNSAVQ